MQRYSATGQVVASPSPKNTSWVSLSCLELIRSAVEKMECLIRKPGVIPVTGYLRSLELSQSFATKHYVFDHSCNTALVLEALSYSIPDSEVRCLLSVRWPAATFSSSERICRHFDSILPSYLQYNERRSGTSASR